MTIALNSAANQNKNAATTANRTRTKQQRNAVKQLRNKAHDKAKSGSTLNLTPKRGRETGGTPPSATHPHKKKDKTSEVPPVEKKRQSIGSSDKNDVIAQKQQICATSNAGSSSSTDLTVPPVGNNSQLIGSNDNVTEENRATVTDQAVAVTIQQNQSTDVEMLSDEDDSAETYASVANQLCVAIIDQRSPDAMTLMDRARFDILYSAILDIILSQVKGGTPSFDDTRLHSGTMKVRCANEFSRKWLEEKIPTIEEKKLWQGAKLVVIDFKDIPKPHKFNVFFPGLKKSREEILKLLELQNKGLITKSWTILNCKAKDGGTAMIIGVGEESFEFLRRKSNSLSCGLGRALFSVVKGQKENQEAMHSQAHSNRAPKKKFDGGTKRFSKKPATDKKTENPEIGAGGGESHRNE